MPPWFRKVFLQWIPWALRMSRPGNKITRRSIYLQNKVRIFNITWARVDQNYRDEFELEFFGSSEPEL